MMHLECSADYLIYETSHGIGVVSHPGLTYKYSSLLDFLRQRQDGYTRKGVAIYVEA